MKKRLLLLLLVVSFGLFFVPQVGDAAGKDQLLVVNKRTNQLAFFENGILIKIYKVATGKTANLTPEGTFYIRDKIVNRPYYKRKIKGGDPNNPLGDRWMGVSFNDHGSFPIGIHGNNNENTIGKYTTAGCIRMHNKDIRELFPKVNAKTSVVITTTNQSLEFIAQSFLRKIASK